MIIRTIILALLLACPLLHALAAGDENRLHAIANDPLASPATRVESLLDLAGFYQQRGFKNKALGYVHEAERYALALDTQNQITVNARLGAALIDSGRYDQASDLLQGVIDSTNGKISRVRAIAFNDLGRVQSAASSFREALVSFEEGLTVARTLGDKSIEVRLLANKSRALLALSEVRALLSTLNDLQFQLDNLDESRTRLQVLISAADLYRSVYWYFDFPAEWILRANANLRNAERIAESLGDTLYLSYAKGYLGRLYEDEENFTAALALTREAAFHANSISAYESAYIWQWQIARIYRKLGDNKAALQNYEHAIDLLEHVRNELIDGSPYTFHEKVQPLFTELSDLLLQSTTEMDSNTQVDDRLRYVQRILEQAKSAELQDYFQNDCVLPEESVDLADVESGTAIIYPVLLADRVEMLVNIGSGIHRFTSDYDKADFELLVNEFRDNLQVDQGDDEYLELAEELYDLLIAPIDNLLVEENIETLLYIPDGSLRTVPMAAFYDGDQFLVQRFAIATTPGLSLTLPRPLELQASKVFAGGISEAVQGFTSLPGVPLELANLGSNYGARVMRDQAFMLERVTTEMSSNDYSVVHIATHGHFDRDPQKSFLLAYDDKLTMNLLEQSIGYRKYVGEPLELLVLSACETAAGDNRAALGLAGVALKAGARSALATLWQISDAATVQLIDHFYRNEVSAQQLTKAQSLQRAQKSLIESEAFFHPSDWAPFLLIGNWL